MENRIALITGGSRGLGRSMALHLARQGVPSIVTYRAEKAEAEKVAAEVKGVALQLDVADSSSFAAFAERVREALRSKWGREQLDFLVNNAGNGLHKPFAETSEKELDDLYKVHLKAPYLLTQKLLPLIADGGRVLNISSGLARFTFPGASAYAVMKGGVEVLTRYLAKELGARGISVNAVAPGAIATDFNGGRVRDDKALNAQVASMIALGRVGLPDDVGAAVASLLTSEGNWINGQRIEVSGGQML